MAKAESKACSFRLRLPVVWAIEELAGQWGVSQTAVIERAVVEAHEGLQGGAARNGVSDEGRKSATGVNAAATPVYASPAEIPGVSLGMPVKSGPDGAFLCGCEHTSCRGAKFMGRTRGAKMCDGCREAGHSGDPRNCGRCGEDQGAI